MLEILGHNVGGALSIPGGLFEIASGVLLIAKGFPAQQSHDYEGQARMSARITHICAPRSATPGGRNLRQIGAYRALDWKRTVYSAADRP
jgi:hypothetical protein